MGRGALAGQVAFITGAGSGLGAAFARRLAADGATIVVADISAAAATAVADGIAGDTAVFDVCDSAAFDAAVDAAVERHGRLDVLINNAGVAPVFDEARTGRVITAELLRMEGRIGEMPPVDNLIELTDEEWDRMLRVHLYGSFYGTRAALRHMQPARRGSIVNVSSVLGQLPSPGAAHYSTAKAGILALTKSAALEVAHLGIRINALCPGYIDTPLLSPMNGIVKDAITMRIASGRMGRAEEVAEVVRFLSGPESSYCIGDTFTASGGYS